MTLAEVRTFVLARLADAEQDLEEEAIGFLGMDAVNRARGKVSALREIRDFIQPEGLRHRLAPSGTDFEADIDRPSREVAARTGQAVEVPPASQPDPASSPDDMDAWKAYRELDETTIRTLEGGRF